MAVAVPVRLSRAVRMINILFIPLLCYDVILLMFRVLPVTYAKKQIIWL